MAKELDLRRCDASFQFSAKSPKSRWFVASTKRTMKILMIQVEKRLVLGQWKNEWTNK
jgi:hypothetical protein